MARDQDGRTVFCQGALPGERVLVSLTEQKKRFARGVTIDIVEPSSDRIEARCPTHHEGCGGCDLAHANVDAQRRIKAHVVRDSLERIGRIDSETIDRAWVGFSDILQNDWYRTTARLAVSAGRLGYRRAASHDIIPAAQCAVVHPQLEAIIASGRFPDECGPEVVLRTSVASGEVLIITDGSPAGVILPDGVEAEIVGRSQLEDGVEIAMTEFAAGRSWHVSAGSFFQTGPHVATELVNVVRHAVGDVVGKSLVDAYSGIGLFAGTIGVNAASLTAIESSTSSTFDARRNLAELESTELNLDIVHGRVEDWVAHSADVIIADPARSGLGPSGLDALLAAEPDRFVLVSCDTGSLGRDAGLLTNAGYELDAVHLVDAFRDTSHVETITRFDRGN